MYARILPLAAVAAAALPAAADWKPAAAPLMTKWGRAVTPETAWQEYPRPQLVRPDWQNLNGLWDYAITAKGAAKPAEFAGQILVPYCAESALSGVGKRVTPDQYLWYRKSVAVPAKWAGKRVLMHFGAVDWECVVSVNGRELATHRGGFDPFTVDVTDAVKDGQAEVVVRVWDPTDTGSQPRGKQVAKPEGIWYTPATGIWQTVWLEPVPETHIRSVTATPDIDAGKVTFRVAVAGPTAGHELAVVVRQADGTQRSIPHPGPVTPEITLTLDVPDAKPWTPDAPTLHDLTVTLRKSKSFVFDPVKTYFAMRKTSIGPDEKGVTRLLLNNKPVFQFGPLDQGYWPDGLLTPPSDAAMKYDLEVLKKVGFNMLRKHIKVEPARYYRYCDEMGLLVWQDMPSGFVPATQGVNPGSPTDAVFTPAADKQFRAELKAVIDHLRGFPSIVAWVPFNEGWGQHDTNDVLKWVKEYDPSRVVGGPSGWQDRGYGDTHDMHNYPGPGMFPATPGRATVLGEFGGLGLPVPKHLWQGRDNWGYETYQTADALGAAYHTLVRKLHPLIGRGLSAAVYTQTTDVEGEVNGLLTYDRAVIKIDPAQVKAWHDTLSGPPPVYKEVTPTSESRPQTWQYTLDTPAGAWAAAGYDAKNWKAGPGGFGTAGTPGATIGTEWKTPAIWARREFDMPNVPAGEVFVRLHHDEDAEVYINGVLAVSARRHIGGYQEFAMSRAARAALKPGRNVIAAHCRQTGGGQYLDAGIVELVPAAAKK